MFVFLDMMGAIHQTRGGGGWFMTTVSCHPFFWTKRPYDRLEGQELTFNCLSDYCLPRAIGLESNTAIMSDY